eukprot:5231202-Ditylum_brightwellii.AAC.1
MPFDTLTKVRKDPNYIELSKLRHEVYQKCAAVYSTQNGYNGHLGLVIDPAKYVTRTTGITYAASSKHPGTYDANIVASSGSVVQSWREEALPKCLLSEIKDCNTGLNDVSLQDIFDHAYDCRGQIDDDLVD